MLGVNEEPIAQIETREHSRHRAVDPNLLARLIVDGVLHAT